MKNLSLLLLSIAILIMAVVVLDGCGEATTPCGTFTFTGSAHSNRGINAQVDFNFNPSNCSATCTCNTICYVQIVRIIDQNTGAFLAPNTDQQNRIVTGESDSRFNGWAIDRLSGRNWGYYGRNNDGTFASTITTGSNTTTATLRDTPSGWPDNSWFDAVSVPVCIQAGAPCVDCLLGYYYWLFLVNGSGDATDPVDLVGKTWMRNAFSLSVAEWNDDAPGLGKNSFPAMSPM
ncbi:MAG TPA: hypothetical protein VFW11_07875 [Cyclobacteriaceae bacterium]|nr:hypothetical protein [Cyclobacteriaceae bacterium]